MENIKTLTTLEKIMLGITKAFKEDTVEELNKVVKVLSVAIWADNHIADEEREKAKEIIKSSIKDEKDSKLVIKLVSEKLEQYKKERWVYHADVDEVMREIIEKREWSYAEYMLEIFKSDKIITDTENELAKHLYHLVEAKKYFQARLGINF